MVDWNANPVWGPVINGLDVTSTGGTVTKKANGDIVVGGLDGTVRYIYVTGPMYLYCVNIQTTSSATVTVNYGLGYGRQTTFANRSAGNLVDQAGVITFNDNTLYLGGGVMFVIKLSTGSALNGDYTFSFIGGETHND